MSAQFFGQSYRLPLMVNGKSLFAFLLFGSFFILDFIHLPTEIELFVFSVSLYGGLFICRTTKMKPVLSAMFV